MKPAREAGLIEVRLAAIESVARDTNVYTFRRPDGGALPAYAPGAHIDVHLPNGLLRQYSLLNPNDDPESYAVAVKRDAQSRGGSSYMFDSLRVGDTLRIGAPRNNFPLVADAAHVVLFAGGIGITPIWCMMRQLAADARAFTLLLFEPLARRHGVSAGAGRRAGRRGQAALRRRGGRQIPRHRRRHRRGAGRTRISIAAGPIRC